jgi:hypothetical protein
MSARCDLCAAIDISSDVVYEDRHVDVLAGNERVYGVALVLALATVAVAVAIAEVIFSQCLAWTVPGTMRIGIRSGLSGRTDICGTPYLRDFSPAYCRAEPFFSPGGGQS